MPPHKLLVALPLILHARVCAFVRPVPRLPARRSPGAALRSCKLGLAPEVTSVTTPVVHRYLRDDGEEWAMWVSGRDSKIMAMSPSSPSTGRIYKLTSKDGASWTQDEGIGELQSSLDVNVDEWWGFDTTHVGLGDVKLGENDKVMTSTGGLYTCYFFGGNFDEEKGGIIGQSTKIGIALSQDGLNWSRLEGEHPTGAALPTTTEEAESLAYPTVVTHTTPTGESIYRMYYSKEVTPGGARVVEVATSPDSFKWTKLGSVFTGSSAATEAVAGDCWDGGGVGRCHVRRVGDEYAMYYEGLPAAGSPGGGSIGLATSPDGIVWKPGNGGRPVLEAEPGGAAWEREGVGQPWMVEVGDEVHVYYAGTAADGTSAIGRAVTRAGDLAGLKRAPLL